MNTSRAFAGHGYSDREIADVVGIVALNLLTGAFNVLAGVKTTDG
ncbi:hypothetical protein [Rhodococcus sp. AG1013]|nr:hypothetical protein [Rhodococcus sp. AG1013]RDI15704.1 hypothetical protein DEU38_13148 [Rhodococcus sp. AG1013]